jgi:hypothetical protein
MVPMDTAELIGLVSAGPNADLLTTISRDSSWNVSADWGLGADWTVVRVPVGLKFRRLTNGLVSEEVLLARGPHCDRATHEKLLALSRVPTHLVMMERPHTPHNRLSRYL